MAAFVQVLNFLYPPRCAGCGDRSAVHDGRRVCARCIARVERMPLYRCE
ncbi:MAG TPA: double zinc ribbon domain-containing protein, partial [Methylomirabilota bacterium]|nr:double zinc ribbon domain-containing protein [Methylomirabilota bacterium]